MSSEYTPEEVLTYSTLKSRTIQSSTSQLQGIYKQPLSFPDLDPEFVITTNSHDMLLETTGEDCKRYSMLQERTKSSNSVAWWHKEMNSVLEDSIYPKLRNLTDMPDADSNEMSDVCTYIFWANVEGIELTFDVSDYDLKLCNTAAD